jgi:acyl-CoA synthetase (AMP-forming)/AMP-acid ligase II
MSSNGDTRESDTWELRTTTSELAERWLAAGWWDDRTLGQLLDEGLREHRRTTFRVHSVERPWEGTFGDVHDAARRLAQGLRSRGVRAADVVAFQLPNTMEAAVVFYAAAFLGAVVVPIVHFYGPKEVGYILRRTGVRAFVAIDRFGQTDYLDHMSRMTAELEDVDIVGVVGLDERLETPVPVVPFTELLSDEPIGGPADVEPDRPALVAYTSGTTSDPKGVIHSHRTIGAEVRQLGALAPDGQPPPLVGLPVGHAMGMLSALLIPVTIGRPIHLVDAWDPPVLLRLMTEHGLSCGSGATFFLTSLLDHPDLTPEHLELMHYVGLGGSAVPSAIAERATAAGISIVRMYGSTEHPSITGGTHDDRLDKRIHTDGSPLGGVEIRLVDDDGVDVAAGEPGEILSRGPECCVGYTDPALTAAAFDGEGWFHTGDVGILDDDRFLRITDRKKDVIIRGGENVSAAKVEEVVARMPGVLEVAVVASPDDRLGERVCAFVRVDADQRAIELDEVRAAVAAAGLARQKWPEELHVVVDMPRTPSGKIQKVVLRDRLRAEHATRAASR